MIYGFGLSAALGQRANGAVMRSLRVAYTLECKSHGCDWLGKASVCVLTLVANGKAFRPTRFTLCHTISAFDDPRDKVTCTFLSLDAGLMSYTRAQTL